MTMHGAIARGGLWSAITFILNLAWEIAHVRLYTIWAVADGFSVASSLLHCSLGDVLIALAAFIAVGLTLKSVDWPVSYPWTGGVMVVVGTMAFTAWSEWYNVYRIGSWGYAASMPTLLGIGLSPMLQWLILPLLAVFAYRVIGPILFGPKRNCVP